VSNYNKTSFFLSIAKELMERWDCSIYVITVSDKDDDVVGKHDFVMDKLRLIYDENFGGVNCCDGVVVNDIIYGDRVLNKDINRSVKLLTSLKGKIFDFLKSNEVQYVVGERTWAHEILISRIALEIDNCSYVTPLSIRIPNGRFGLFIDEYFRCLMSNPENVVCEKTFLLDRPDYFEINNTRVKNRVYDFGNIFTFVRGRVKNIKNKDYVLYLPWRYGFMTRIRRLCNYMYYKYLLKKENVLPESDFVFYGLHMQPEASVDVIGRFYEDQWINILNIWRSIPRGWFLVVKEHSNAIGDRGFDFFSKLRKLPGVVVISDTFDSREIISRSRCVFTVSGTIAYEALLMGVPSFTYGDVFFNESLLCRKISLEDLRHNDVPELINDVLDGIELDLEVNRFKSYVISKSFSGIISDSQSNPQCMNNSNIELVAKEMFSAFKNQV